MYRRYVDVLCTTAYTAQILCEKEFPGLLKTCKRRRFDRHLPETDNAARRAIFDDNNLKKAAVYLRNLIISSETPDLPDPLKADQGTKPS